MDGYLHNVPRAKLAVGGRLSSRGRWPAALLCTLVLHALAATALLLPWRGPAEPVAMISVELVVATAAPPTAMSAPAPDAIIQPGPAAVVPAPPTTADPTKPAVAPVPMARPRPRAAAKADAAAPGLALFGPATAGPAVVASVAAATVSPSWRQALAAWIAARKTYPAVARRRGTEGMVTLRFTVERSGRVAAVAVRHSSGSETLDAAALAILRDAVVPGFPAEMVQDSTTETVNIGYALTAPAG